MIEKLYISYSLSERIVFNFWKSFFQICGIWLEEEEIWEENFHHFENLPHLLILGTKDEKFISPVEKEGYVYLVKKNAKFAKYEARSDVIKMDRWEKTGKIFLMVLEKLLGSRGEVIQLTSLLKIFTQEKLWSVMWLYNEMSFCKDEFYNDYIKSACEKTLWKLKGKDGWHYNYMKLFCLYMIYGISGASLPSPSNECIMLLEKCDELSERSGWSSSLYMLAGKVCELSQTECRYALNYYRSITDNDRNAEVLYCIGHSYEKIMKDIDSAIYCYKESYRLDPDYFRAAYKVAIKLEEDGKWMAAFLIYGKIELVLMKYSLREAISIKEIEYRYKIYKKLIGICDRYISGYTWRTSYKTEIDNMIGQIKQGKIFTKLLYFMFGDKKIDISKHVLNDIYEKSSLECLN